MSMQLAKLEPGVIQNANQKNNDTMKISTRSTLAMIAWAKESAWSTKWIDIWLTYCGDAAPVRSESDHIIAQRFCSNRLTWAYNASQTSQGRASSNVLFLRFPDCARGDP